MPNIVITEGLDTPWELKDTESNITAETDLDSINLANQTVGTLAYTSSQLLGSLKTEKDNLDKIVDAIELINEEIALYPGRVAKWDSVRSLNIPDNAVDVVTLPLFNTILATPLPGKTGLTGEAPVNFIGDRNSGLEEERNYIATLNLLIQAKPLLDNAVDLQNNPIGYVYLTEGQSVGASELWLLTTSVVEGSKPGIDGNPGDLVVYRNSSGQPYLYENVYSEAQENQDTFIRRQKLSPSEVFSFAVPRDKAELARWRDAVSAADLIAATNTLKNSTGLPEGVTPPVTTLGVSVEKYYDRAKYSLGTFIINSVNTTIPSPPSNPIIMDGDYPPIQRADLDLEKLTQADVGKFFQKPGIDTVYYISEKRSDGTFLVREGVVTADKYISKMTDDIKKALRGEYAEKQILLTQRSTDQTQFVSSITQRYTTFSDMATNLLKTLMNFYNDLARNIRG